MFFLGMLWQNFDKARWSGVRDLAHEKLYPLLKDGIPEVRAAAVFALGTFISSVTDRSEEHANNIDRIIAITLLETVGEDMSPLVRLELVAALQWMVLLFESQFVTVYMQESMSGSTLTASGERSASISHGMIGNANVTTTTPPMHHSTHSLERHVTMRRGVSSGSISNMAASSIPFQSIFLRLWQGIYNLGQDPFPRVAETAQKVISYVRDAAVCLITAKEATSAEKCISLSVSLPPSPNTRINYLSGESPPVGGGNAQVSQQQAAAAAVTSWATKLRNNPLMGAASGDPQALLQRKLRTSSMNDETDSSLNAGNAAGANTTEPGGSASARSSTSDNNFDSKSQTLKPIVVTDFIPWAISYFTRPGKNRYTSCEANEGQQLFPVDENSPELRTRNYRFHRNQQIRRMAREQQARQTRIDTQCWIGKTQFTPSIVKLLPYESQIAVAYKEKVSVYDWSRTSVRSYTPQTAQQQQKQKYSGSSSPPPPAYASASHSTASRVSAIEFLNAHDVGLILVGHEDGVIRVWQQPDSNEAQQHDSRLVTAWEALPLINSYGTSISATSTAAKYRKDASGIGIVTAWQQSTEQLVVGGGSCRFLRLWDVNRELKLGDISIGAETSVRVIAPFLCNVKSDLIATGCSDGSVRLFDKRCAPQDARIRVYREHNGAILTACLKTNQTSLITGCAQGKVCVLDMRSSGPSAVLHQWDVGTDVMAITGHQSADVVACGSAHKITIYNQNGKSQSVLRSNEGFMGPKIGHPSCLSFHSYKVSLAVGFVDNTVAVYGPSPGIPFFLNVGTL